MTLEPTPVGGQGPKSGGPSALLQHGHFVDVPCGRLQPDVERRAELLIVVGAMLLVEHGAQLRVSAEALGPGDAFTLDQPDLVGAGAACGLQAIEPARVLVLDRPLVGLLAQ